MQASSAFFSKRTLPVFASIKMQETASASAVYSGAAETPAAADKNTNKAASTAHKSLDFFTITSHAAETAVKLPDGIRPIRFIHMPREKKICPRLYAGAHICHKF